MYVECGMKLEYFQLMSWPAAGDTHTSLDFQTKIKIVDQSINIKLEIAFFEN